MRKIDNVRYGSIRAERPALAQLFLVDLELEDRMESCRMRAYESNAILLAWRIFAGGLLSRHSDGALRRMRSRETQ